MVNVPRREACVNGMFQGHVDPLMELANYAGNPNGSLTADFTGQFCWDSTNDDWYVNHTNATTWAKVNY